MSLPLTEQITFLYTHDLKKCDEFYEKVLGLSLTLDQGGCKIWQVVDQKAYIGMCERASASDKPQGIMFTFVTPDVDAWYEQITSHGVTCEHAPRINEEYGIYHFFVRDPNGYMLEFQRFLDADWNR